ncbi:DUF6597 domain-containing transcriptional factor [Anaerosphaera multitolerans]|uniref:Helix-turn-helix domain-containing protein n=1 Tax=Anaerosphaera multitolerans TaxID=2487351 RepID=A0A437S8Q4_9FIRM|nr:DUF6597 domain-containing transcriptional factor [Anaerosphaera multitolerans]RVU55476.1 helix-turn-helix domain-containing protein [Anaerosphaera multitolerans]
MYYPIQIPYKLDENFLKHIKYNEEKVKELSNFVICYWEMIPRTKENIHINNIIITDGCIDLVVDFDNKVVGFSGMSTTDFNFTVSLPGRFMGLRFLPGAFYQLTGISASIAMDNFLNIQEVYEDFDCQRFLNLSFNEAKTYLLDFIKIKFESLNPSTYTLLFNKLCENPPSTARELHMLLNLSASQCQRNFIKHYGIGPKKVLSILRFQKCLRILTSTESKPIDILELVQYYDQSHFINDFKGNIGITPFELLSKYRDD